MLFKRIKKLKEKYRRKFFLIATIAVLILAGSLMLTVADFSDGQEPIWGVTFSQKFAKELDLNWRKVYIAMLDDLKIDHVRLAAYWDEVEPVEGEFHFTDLDWMLNQAQRRDVKVTLAVGRRLPRWPECHLPTWSSHLDGQQLDEPVANYISRIIERYKGHIAIDRWQVENEPLLRVFGICPKFSLDQLKSEVALVRSLDPSRPVMTTDSGELSLWLRASKPVDTLGVTMYYRTWNPILKNFRYPWPPAYYAYKAALAGKLRGVDIIGSELQAEPWPPNHLSFTEIDPGLHSKLLNTEELIGNIDFARRTGFGEHYLWGVEWWYWLKENGQPEVWELMRNLWS